MITIKFINEKNSVACKEIMKATGITRFNKSGPSPELLINYGLSGLRKEKFFKKYPRAKSIPTINAFCGMSKFNAVRLVRDCGILVPESKASLNKTDRVLDWIEKKNNSYGGKDIQIARQKYKLLGKYYQKFVGDRVYELRVHAFSWVPKDQWLVLKRVGEEGTIAWNYSQGGRFLTIHNQNKVTNEAKKLSEDVLRVMHMEFGAVDFIVDSKRNIYFIEINSQPGMTGLSNNVYVRSFNRLKVFGKENIIKFFNH